MTEIELVDAAVRSMQREGVGITPGRVEVAVNAARGCADLLQGRSVAGLFLTPRSPDGRGGQVHKAIRTGPPVLATFAVPTAYFQLSDARRTEYQAQVAGLKAQLANPGLDPVVKGRLQQDLSKVQHLLDMDRSPTPDHRSFEELRQQR